MVLKPKIASAIAVKLTEWENKPIIRVEVIGDSLSSWEKVKRILDQRASEINSIFKLQICQPYSFFSVLIGSFTISQLSSKIIISAQ